jgi:nucleotide-binding universal stress UspA family protein
VKTILAPVDFSPATEAVVAESVRLAKVLPAKVVLLAVIQPPVITTEYAALMENSGEILAAGEKNAARRLAAIEEKLRAEGVAVEGVQCVGAPIQHIVRQAESADYVVMGSHGHTALYDLLVGSTTHGVLMRAKCPVVIVPSGSRPARPTG